MSILVALAAWFGLAGLVALGWSRFHRHVGPTPVAGRVTRRRLAA
jgi:hypothetical protein